MRRSWEEAMKGEGRSSAPQRENAPEALRLFVSLDPPEAARQAVMEAVQAARPLLPPGWNWSAAAKLHLTLRFIGETGASLLPEFRRILEEVAAAHPPLTLTLGGWGAFPHFARPRVLWLGVADDPPGTLVALARELARRLPGDDAKPFQPHLTLARTQEPPLLSPEIPDALPPVQTSWSAGEIRLLRSTLTPRGSVYTPLHRARLGGVA
ncbi:MAG: RNA 2',3'-cyclic phosphodiesterase [Magnetococcales bacterium]|nr:RNA 2',3'-cyclic phosphodiesterase [Magnetococcales bacterium]